jgi:hypothetical protein
MSIKGDDTQLPPISVAKSDDMGPETPSQGLQTAPVTFLSGIPILQADHGLPVGWKGKLHLYLHDEAPTIGCGWRTLTVHVGPRRVSVCNHHTSDKKRLPRETFNRVLAASIACELRCRPVVPPDLAEAA